MSAPTWGQLARRLWAVIRQRCTPRTLDCATCGWPVTKVPGKRGYWECVPCRAAQEEARVRKIRAEERKVARTIPNDVFSAAVSRDSLGYAPLYGFTKIKRSNSEC